MSAATLAHAASHSPTESKFHVFVQVAMLLAVITGVEIVVIYLPLPHWLVLGVLALLSLVKFMFVIFIFMHLRWDKVFCTVLFFIGLVLATGTAAALYLLFAARDSKPLGSAYESAALVAPASPGPSA